MGFESLLGSQVLGRVGEWFKPAVLKTADVKASLSSNLSSSASYVEHIVVVATQIVILLVWVRFPLFNPYGISIMDNTVGFYPTNVGSIPAGETKLRMLTANFIH